MVKYALLLLLLGIVCFIIPISSPRAIYLDWNWQLALSFLWGLGFLLSSVSLFMLASGTKAFTATALCLLASLCLGCSIGEFGYLLTEQPADGLVDGSNQSRFVLSGEARTEITNWEKGICGSAIRKSNEYYSTGHRYLHKNEVLFDARYDLTPAGRRSLPLGNHLNTLMLFGCSFTFGHGLNNDETWAWQLAKLLGPDWDVENYAANGYGPSQMLCMLEQKLIDPPKGSERLAFFLAIHNQLLRNDLFINGPHYQAGAEGMPAREGNHKYGWLAKFERYANGSQLARQAAFIIMGAIANYNSELVDLYVKTLQKSACILKDNYNTSLIILLWPDFEYLAPYLKEAGLSYISVKAFLTDWENDDGIIYRIHPEYEAHPNALASALIARGIYAEMEKLGY